MITAETFERLRNLARGCGALEIEERCGSNEEEKEIKASVARSVAEIDELEKYWQDGGYR